MGTTSSKQDKTIRKDNTIRRKPSIEHVRVKKITEAGTPLPSEHGVLMNITILFKFIRRHTEKLYPAAVQETVQLFGKNNPPIDGINVANILLNLPPQLRKKTWKEAAGRRKGSNGYSFGDIKASLARQTPASAKHRKHRESVKNLFFQYRSITNEMSEQELVEMAVKFFPQYSMKDCIEGMRMFQEIQHVKRKLYEDLENLLRLMVRLTRETLYWKFAKADELYSLGLSFDQIDALVEQICKAEELSSKPLPKAPPQQVKFPTAAGGKVLSLMAQPNGQLVPVSRSKTGETRGSLVVFNSSNAKFLDMLTARIRKRNTFQYLHNSESKFKTMLPIYRSHNGCARGMLKRR